MPTAEKLSRLKRRLSEDGLVLSSIAAYAIGPGTGVDDLRRVIDCAAELGASLVTTTGLYDDHNRIVEVAAQVGAYASQCGLGLAIEPIPYNPVANTAQALSIAEQTGMVNVGLTVDLLLLARAGEGADELAGLPSDRVKLVQVSDGPRHPAGSLQEEARTDRRLLGHGALPIAAMLAALGHPDLVECEIPLRRMLEEPMAERARHVFAATRSYFAQFE